MNNEVTVVTNGQDLLRDAENGHAGSSPATDRGQTLVGPKAADGTQTTAVSPFSEGATLVGRYKILKTLGAGGMGKVFQVLDLENNTVCAVKIMNNQLAGREAGLKRFHREASVSLSLKHPNIVNVLDLGSTEDDKPFIVMEYIEGKSLDDIIEAQQRLSLPQFIDIFRQICQGIAYAHINNVVHRDIKPGNIMIIEENGRQRAKVVDFGIARICKTTGEVCPTTTRAIQVLLQLSNASSTEEIESLQHLTQPGELFGSPLYMSPEQFRGEEADCRSDVYSLGCMMFESLTGVPPLKGRSSIETVIKRLNDPAPSISDVIPGLVFPAEIESIVACALAHDPADRFGTVEALGTALSATGLAIAAA
jgi:eukaryotic-like serine/threonine-protein kinase